MMHAAAVLLVAFASLTPRLLAAQTPPSPAPTGDRNAATHGVYTAEQAAKGDTVFQKTCASCHDLNFHKDEQFRMNWFGRNTWELFKILKTTMPEDNIGGLTDDEYTRVIAYIFKVNGFPAGTDSLRADSLDLRRIKIGPPSGGSSDSTKPRR